MQRRRPPGVGGRTQISESIGGGRIGDSDNINRMQPVAMGPRHLGSFRSVPACGR
jgi:hypothetical protein